MRIIERGQPPIPEKEITCKTCRSKLSYGPNDVEHHEGYDQRDPAWDSIKCPVCREEIAVPGFSAAEKRIALMPKGSQP